MNRTVVILGGSGFVGQAICEQLLEGDFSIRILTRNKGQASSAGLPDAVELVEGDVYSDDFLDASFNGADTVINLIGILNERGHDGSEFRKVHAELPRRVAESCLNSGVRRLVHMSALNADAMNGPSQYLRTKGVGEDAVMASNNDQLMVTSFQPSVIFGEHDSFFNRFADLLRIVPFVFPLACADARFAPVFVGDVAARFVAAIDDDSLAGQCIPLCGPMVYTLRELVEYTASLVGARNKVIGLPDPLSRMQANVFEWIPGKPFSVDNYNSLKRDSVCEGNDTESTTIEDIAPGYIHP